MKLHQIAIATALVAAGSSAFATTYNFRLSGSSALQKVVAKAIANNCSSLTTLTGLLGSAAAGPLDNANGQSQTLYVCTIASTSAWGAPYSTGGANVVNIYMNTQGSAYGVFPVAYGLPTAFIDPATCGASTCTGVTTTFAPDAGLSDLEPTAFNALSNHPVDPTVGGQYFVNGNPKAPAGTVYPKLFAQYTKVSGSSFASSKIAAVQTFGLAVSNALYADLQADQNTSGVPTVSSSALATIYSPGYSTLLGNWQPLFTGALANAATVNNQVNICSRLPGSGTRASAQALFLNAPFSSVSQAFATAANDNTGGDTTISQTISQNNQGTYEIGEYDNSGAVTGCIANANLPANNAYAIGLLSVDRASGGTTGFQFVNLDGSVPNTSAASVGKYNWVFEAFYNISKTAVDGQFATAFGNAFKTPTNISNLGLPSTNGVMAAVPNCTAGYSGVNSVCSHVTRNGNSGAILTYAQ